MNEELLAKRFRELSLQLTSQGYTPQDILYIIKEEDTIPATIFSGTLSPLQALVTYLKDVRGRDFNAIATILGRSYRAIWGAYEHTGAEFPHTTTFLPLSIFTEELSILEAAVKHLKEAQGLRYSQIARLLNKDDRTIWTVYHRAQKKCEH